MSLLNVAGAAMAKWPAARLDGASVVIPTHCLFASGGVVQVVLEPRHHGNFAIHDAGAAINEFASNGGDLRDPAKILRAFLKPTGFVVSGHGVISSPPVPEEEIAPAVALLANAVRDSAQNLLDRWRPVVKRDFKKDLRTLLEGEFAHLKNQPTEIGKSTRQHKFDFALNRKGGGLLLIDAVSHDASSINASVIRNIDVRNSDRADLDQRVIYDDHDEWRAADLNLLNLGARPIPFSRAHDVLERLAA